MEAKKKELSYEELKQVASELSQQNQQLNNMLREANFNNIFKRLDYLFKVLECSEAFNSDFVIRCSEEIQELMSPPESTEDDKA